MIPRCLGTLMLVGIGLALRPTPGLAQYPPETPIQANVESYFGEVIDDPYRWLEDLNSVPTRDWFTQQNRYTREVLDALPGRAALHARIRELNSANTRIRALQSTGDALFYLKCLPGEQQFKLYMRTGPSGTERIVGDPATFGVAGQTPSIDFYQASPNGKRVALGISQGGGENTMLYVIDTSSGRLVGPPLRRAGIASPSWRFDSDGLFFTRQSDPVPNAAPADWLRDGQVWMRTYAADGSVKDNPVFGIRLSPAVELAADDLPNVVASPISPFAIGVVRHGVRNELTLYVAPLAQVRDASSPWRKFVGPEGGITNFTLRGEWIYFVTNSGAPRGQVMRWSLRDPRPFQIENAEEVVAPSERIVLDIAAAKDALYVRQTEAGYAKLLRLEYNVKLARPSTPARRNARAAASKAPAALPKQSGIARGRELTLPFGGAIDELATDPLRSGAYLRLTSWTEAPTYFGVDGKSGQIVRIAWSTPINANFDRIATLQARVRSHDGTLVPLSVIFSRNLVRDGKAPLLIETYGAYGRSSEPYFWPSLLAWLEQGGVFAVAHIRGGGELGTAWHLDGMQSAKPNSWRDLIACADWLVSEQWTKSARLAVMGVGAGGIAAGNAIVERPELFAVMVSRVGLHDTLRGESGTSGSANVPEFGSVATETGFRGLLAMSTYQRMRDGVRYPAALFSTVFNDPRVDPWDAGKAAARMQAVNGGFGGSRNTVLLRVDFDATRGSLIAPGTTEIDTDIFSFLLWQTGARGFTPN